MVIPQRFLCFHIKVLTSLRMSQTQSTLKRNRDTLAEACYINNDTKTGFKVLIF